MARKDGWTSPFEVGHEKADVASATTGGLLVAAVPGKRIRVLAVAFVCGATGTNATLLSASTAISPVFQNAANSGAVLPFNPIGWFETERGEPLNITTGAGSTTGVVVVYAET